MRGAVIHETRDIRVEDREKPTIHECGGEGIAAVRRAITSLVWP